MPKLIYGIGDTYQPSTEVPRDTEDVDAIDVEVPVQTVLNNTAYLYGQNQAVLERMASLERQLARFDLISTVTSLVLEPGRSYAFQDGVRVNRFGGFADAVTVTGINLPAGVTATLNPNPTAGSALTLTLDVAAGAVAGQYDLLLRGEGGGRSVELRIPVRVAPQTLPPSFSISGPSITAIDRTQNAPQGTVALNVERSGGFNSVVAFDVAQVPAGVTVAFSSASVGGADATTRNATVATLTAGPQVPAGRYTVVLRATGGGVVRTWSVTLDVTGAPAVGTDFSLRVVYDGGDPYSANGATIYIDRAGGFAGPVYLQAEQLASKASSPINLLDSVVATFWLSNWPVILINGQRGTVRIDGNAARVTADSLGAGWTSGGIAPQPVGGAASAQFGQTVIRGSLAVDTPAGAPTNRYADISVRRGNRYWRELFNV